MLHLDDFPLPFGMDSLNPQLSKTAIDLHYNKHLNGYINKLNELISGSEYENMYLYEIIKQSAKNQDTAIFNNAAQIYNHDFFFKNLSKTKSEIPKKLSNAFGGADKFKEQFKAAAMSVFGSGWVWLVGTADNYSIITTSNAGCPIVMDVVPLLTLDVWEHAYYPDYQNRRADFVDAFLEHLVDWDKVEKKL